MRADNKAGGDVSGIEQCVARQAHNLEVTGSNPVPAIWARRLKIFDSFFFIILIWMGVDLGACYVAVSEQLLDGPHVGYSHKLTGKGVT